MLVNCQKGVSRSSAAVLAYLMLRHNMTAVAALVQVTGSPLCCRVATLALAPVLQVRQHRDVRPNDGFLRQLAELDNKLRRERGELTSS